MDPHLVHIQKRSPTRARNTRIFTHCIPSRLLYGKPRSGIGGRMFPRLLFLLVLQLQFRRQAQLRSHLHLHLHLQPQLLLLLKIKLRLELLGLAKLKPTILHQSINQSINLQEGQPVHSLIIFLFTKTYHQTLGTR
jgi:hypothetical protein